MEIKNLISFRNIFFQIFSCFFAKMTTIPPVSMSKIHKSVYPCYITTKFLTLYHKGIKEKLKSLDRQKSRGQFRAAIKPLQYDIVLYPNYNGSQKNTGLEMKVHLLLTFTCHNSTNLLQLSTREFSTIALTFVPNSARDG